MPLGESPPPVGFELLEELDGLELPELPLGVLLEEPGFELPELPELLPPLGVLLLEFPELLVLPEDDELIPVPPDEEEFSGSLGSISELLSEELL